MKIATGILWMSVSLVVPAAAQPVVDGVFNNASYAFPGLPNSGIAQGSLFAIFGQNLGPPQLVEFPGLPKPIELAGTNVQVMVQGVTVDAFLYYTSDRQLAAVLPSTTPVGDGVIIVTYNGQQSAPAPIKVVKAAFGIFTANSQGHGPAIVQNWYPPGVVKTNSLTEAAVAGQAAILWGTGLGPLPGAAPDDAGAPPIQNLDVDVQVLVGGKPAEIFYKGRSAQFPGVDQLQFLIAAGVQGCRVSIVVIVEGVASNYGTIAIAPANGVCEDPLEFSSAELQTAMQNGKLRIGVIALTRIRASVTFLGLPFPVSLDQGLAEFYERDLASLMAARGVTEGAPSLGSCIVYTFAQGDDDLQILPTEFIPRTGLDAGPVLDLVGPKGARQLLQVSTGVYAGDLGGGIPGSPEFQPEYLDPGPYTVTNGAGGADVGAFQRMLDMPEPIDWTNMGDIIEVNRTQDLTVTWTGANPNTEFVTIGGISGNTDDGVVGSFICAELADKGTFTVPAAVLSSLPVTTPWLGQGLPNGGLSVGTAPLADAARFNAPGLDAAYFLQTTQVLKALQFK